MRDRLEGDITENFILTAKMMASKKCKTCYGRGYVAMSRDSLPKGLSVDKYNYCTCTKKTKR